MAAIATGNPAADPSARFVLPPASPLVGNLAALWATDPALAAAVERLDESDPDALTPEPARDGSATVAAPMPDGRRVYLHSRHRPGDEAARLIDAAVADVDRHVVYYLFGLGLGHHLDVLFDRAGDESVFYVFEPDLRVLRAALTTRDLTRLIDSRRVSFVTTADKADLFARLTRRSALIALGTAAVDHPPSVRRDPAFHDGSAGGSPSSPPSPRRT